jgi:hypothetical protein
LKTFGAKKATKIEGLIFDSLQRSVHDTTYSENVFHTVRTLTEVVPKGRFRLPISETDFALSLRISQNIITFLFL